MDNTTVDNKKQIEVRLANCKPIPFMINEDEEEIAIKAQEDVTHIWKVWRERYSKEKSSFEVMAMVAFQYARLYYTKDAHESSSFSKLSSNSMVFDSCASFV